MMGLLVVLNLGIKCLKNRLDFRLRGDPKLRTEIFHHRIGNSPFLVVGAVWVIVERHQGIEGPNHIGI